MWTVFAALGYLLRETQKGYKNFLMRSPSSLTSGSSASDLPQISTIAPRDRSRGRNVHICDANNPATELGGLVLTNGVTNANFYSMIEILVLFESDFELRHEDSTKMERNDNPLQLSKYYINTSGEFSLYRILPS
jgi:hypothetical protein